MNLGHASAVVRGPDIVVGVDGSEPSTRALVWAMTLAASRDWTIEVVTAWPKADAVFVHEVPGHFSAPRHHASTMQNASIVHARREVECRPVLAAQLVNARPLEALLARAGVARLVVVGARADSARGSHRAQAPIGERLALLSQCPVIVVRNHEPESPTQQSSASKALAI